MIGTGSLI